MALGGLDQVLVAGRAVEQGAQAFILPAQGGGLQHEGAAGVARDVVCQVFHRLAVGGGVRQQEHPVAHDGGAQRFERAQHAHAYGGVVGGQRRDHREPVFVLGGNGLGHCLGVWRRAEAAAGF
jgi:hypothetical protein